MPMPFPTAGPRPWWLVRGQSKLLNTLAGHGLAWRMVLPRCDLQVQRQRTGAPSLPVDGSFCRIEAQARE